MAKGTAHAGRVHPLGEDPRVHAIHHRGAMAGSKLARQWGERPLVGCRHRTLRPAAAPDASRGSIVVCIPPISVKSIFLGAEAQSHGSPGQAGFVVGVLLPGPLEGLATNSSLYAAATGLILSREPVARDA